MTCSFGLIFQKLIPDKTLSMFDSFHLLSHFKLLLQKLLILQEHHIIYIPI